MIQINIGDKFRVCVRHYDILVGELGRGRPDVAANEFKNIVKGLVRDEEFREWVKSQSKGGSGGKGEKGKSK